VTVYYRYPDLSLFTKPPLPIPYSNVYTVNGGKGGWRAYGAAFGEGGFGGFGYSNGGNFYYTDTGSYGGLGGGPWGIGDGGNGSIGRGFSGTNGLVRIRWY
jgi:hypothetical protein